MRTFDHGDAVLITRDRVRRYGPEVNHPVKLLLKCKGPYVILKADDAAQSAMVVALLGSGIKRTESFWVKYQRLRPYYPMALDIIRSTNTTNRQHLRELKTGEYTCIYDPKSTEGHNQPTIEKFMLVRIDEVQNRQGNCVVQAIGRNDNVGLQRLRKRRNLRPDSF